MSIVCNAAPYEGNDPFLAVIGSREDPGVLYPLIERLAGRGVRVWFDAGNQAVSLSPEVIAERLKASSCCLILLSEQSVQSHFCRTQLIYAVESGKPVIPVLYQEPKLTIGIRLLLGSAQSFPFSLIPSGEQTEAVLSSPLLSKCTGMPDPSIVFHDYTARQTETVKSAPAFELLQVDREEEPGKAAPPTEKIPDPAEQVLPVGEMDDEMTVADTQEDDLDKTIAVIDPRPPVIIRIADRQKLKGKPDFTIIGRSREKTDLCIPDPKKSVSGKHIRVYSIDGINYIEDLHSTNGTFINGERIPQDARVTVEECVEVRLAETRLLIAFHDAAESLWKAKALLALRSDQTDETRYLWNGSMILGRKEPWKNGVLASNRVGREHARILLEDAFYLEDNHSLNGTWLNDEKIPPDRKIRLGNGDRINIEGNLFVAEIIQFE